MDPRRSPASRTAAGAHHRRTAEVRDALYEHSRNKMYASDMYKYVQINMFFLLPVELFIDLDCFGVSCLVLDISGVEISAFFLI